MPKEFRFHCTVDWSGKGRGTTTNYESYSREFQMQVEGKAPLTGSAAPEYKGDASLVNPEELLLGAISSCTLLTFLALAGRAQLEVLDYRDSCEAVLAMKDGKMRVVSVHLRPAISLRGNTTRQQVEELVEKAHQYCFISNSVSAEVTVSPAVELVA